MNETRRIVWIIVLMIGCCIAVYHSAAVLTAAAAPVPFGLLPL